MSQTYTDALKKRLDTYWKLELANVLLVPAFIIFFSHDWGDGLSWISYVVMIPMCLLLAIGGLYWRAKLRKIEGTPEELENLLPKISTLQIPVLMACIFAAILASAVWFKVGLAKTNTDKWVVTFVAILSVLEYINYYHRQLQHFDHQADWKRITSGKGFRPSQMAMDLRRWRKKFM